MALTGCMTSIWFLLGVEKGFDSKEKSVFKYDLRKTEILQMCNQMYKNFSFLGGWQLVGLFAIIHWGMTLSKLMKYIEVWFHFVKGLSILFAAGCAEVVLFGGAN